MLTTWATDWLGPANVRRSRVRWTERVWPDDTLTCSGEIEREYTEDGETKVDLVLQAKNQEGIVVVKGWMTFVLPAGRP